MKVISEERENEVREEIQRIQKAYDDTVAQYNTWRAALTNAPDGSISAEEFDRREDTHRGYKHCITLLSARASELMEELQELTHFHMLALGWSQSPHLPRA